MNRLRILLPVFLGIAPGFALPPPQYIAPWFEEMGVSADLGGFLRPIAGGGEYGLNAPLLSLPLSRGRLVYQGSLHSEAARNAHFYDSQTLYYNGGFDRHTFYAGAGHAYSGLEDNSRLEHNYCNHYDGGDGRCLDSASYRRISIIDRSTNNLSGAFSGAWEYARDRRLTYTATAFHSIRGGYDYEESYREDADIYSGGLGKGVYRDYSGNSFATGLFLSGGFWRSFGPEGRRFSWLLNLYYRYHRDRHDITLPENPEPYFTEAGGGLPTTLEFPGWNNSRHEWGIDFSGGETAPDRAPAARGFSAWLRRLTVAPLLRARLRVHSEDYHAYSAYRWERLEEAEWGITERRGDAFYLALDLDHRVRMYLFRWFFIEHGANSAGTLQFLPDWTSVTLGWTGRLDLGIRRHFHGHWFAEGGVALMEYLAEAENPRNDAMLFPRFSIENSPSLFFRIALLRPAGD